MKEMFRYSYYGVAIPKNQFTDNVPSDWKPNELGEYSWGGYKATEID